jgi:hypothetical protein
MAASRYLALQDLVPIRALLRRNQRVRRAADELEAVDHHVPRRRLWPLALQQVSRFPTLLYRFFRKGNLLDLALQLEHTSNQKKRSRDQLALSDS